MSKRVDAETAKYRVLQEGLVISHAVEDQFLN